MKTKNQTEHKMLELVPTSAANEDGFSQGSAREASASNRKQAWSPYEVWRTRVRGVPQRNSVDSTPIRR